MLINYFLADKNEKESLKIAGSYKFESWINNENNTITHTSAIETDTMYPFPEAKLGKYYRVTLNVTCSTNSGIYVSLGNVDGTLRTATGTYQETLLFAGPKEIKLTAYGNVTVNSINVEEYVVYAEPLDFTDTDGFIDNSWTLSFSMKADAWISFHSYIPNYYITTSNNLFSFINDELSPEYTLRDEYMDYIVDHKGRYLTYR